METKQDRKPIPSVDEINQAFKDGDITAEKRQAYLHLVAQRKVDDMMNEEGYFGTFASTLTSEVQKGWDNFTNSAKNTKEATTLTGTAKNSLWAMWGQVQILSSVFTAFGAANGAAVEKMAKNAGASDRLAFMLGKAVEIGSSFMTPGLEAKAFGQGVQAGGKAFKAVAEKVGQAVEKKAAEEAAAKLAEKAAKQVIGEGLKAEGLNAEQIAGAVGKETANKIEAEAEAVKEVIPPIQDRFLQRLKEFKDTMKNVTEKEVFAETERLAKALGLTIDDLRRLPLFSALNNKEMLGYLKALEPEWKKAIDLSNRALADGTEESLNAAIDHISDLFTYAPIFRSAEVSAGRSVQILNNDPRWKAITDMLSHINPEEVANGNLRAAKESVVKMIRDLGSEDERKVAQLVISGQNGIKEMGSKYWGYVQSLAANIYFAGPVTWARKAIGDTLMTGTSMVENSLGGVFSLDPELTIGQGAMRGVNLARGFTLAIGDGLEALAKAMKGQKVEMAPMFDEEIGKDVSRFGKWGVPTNILKGINGFFQTVNFRAHLYMQALEDASRNHLSIEDTKALVEGSLVFPTPKMAEDAQRFALGNTASDPLGKINKTIQQALQYGPLYLWFPAMKTPLNLAKWGWNHTPGLNLISKSLYADILAGGARADQAVGRLALSWMAAQYIYGMAQAGLITGGGPTDAGLKRSWMLDKQPYSLKTKDGWYPLNNFEPHAGTLALVADFAELHNKMPEMDAEHMAMATLLTVARDISQKSWWPTLTNMMEIVNSGATKEIAPTEKNPNAIRTRESYETQLERTITQPFTTLGSGGPLVAREAKIQDPVVRDARNLMDSYKKNIPGYSDQVPPKRDGLGNVVPVPQVFGKSLVDQIETSPSLKHLGLTNFYQLGSPLTFIPKNTDSVAQAMADHNVQLPSFPDFVKDVPITPQQRDRRQSIYNELLYDANNGVEANILSDPDFKSAPLARRRLELQNAVSHAFNESEQLLMNENPDIREKVEMSNYQKNRPRLDPSDRPTADEEIKNAISEMKWEIPPPNSTNLILNRNK